MIIAKTVSMRLLISGDRLIKDLRKDFSLAYPFLQLEFFTNDSARKTRYAANTRVDHEKYLKDAWNQKSQNGSIDIKDSMTVLELENVFIDEFGLSVQVFRKSGNIWLESTMTDDWTLKQQNDHGREITLSYQKENGEFNDFDLNRDV